jgi:nitrate/nitrite-specific signal transduction histidine kinase
MKQLGQTLTETQKYGLAGIGVGLLFPIVGFAIKTMSESLPFSLSSVFALHATEPLLWIIDTAPFFLGLISALVGKRQEQLKVLNQELQARENELLQERQKLEKRVEDRTDRLIKKTDQLRSASYIARQTAEIQDLAAILNNVVNLITDQFGFYHTGIFLVNETGDEVILQATSSEGGRQMMEKGHSLTIGTQGIVGYVAAQKKSRIALDVGSDAVFFNNPYLPMTRSEAAIPLLIRNCLFGIRFSVFSISSRTSLRRSHWKISTCSRP